MSRVCQPLTSIIYVQAGDARGRGRGALVCARHTVRTPRYASRVSDILIPPSCIPTASPTISSRRRHRRHRHRRHARATSSFAIFIRVTRRVNPRAASIFALSPPPPSTPNFPILATRSLHSFVRPVLRIIAFLCRYAISFPSLVEIPPIMSRFQGFD